RVPLAELNWKRDIINEDNDEIDDCRKVFLPLSKPATCCTFRVGDGITSHGDFTSIQWAIRSLPESGGQICVLPGVYPENISIAPPRNSNISIKGCGERTQILVFDERPAITVKDGVNVSIESLKITSVGKGVGVLLKGDNLQNLKLENLHVEAAE